MQMLYPDPLGSPTGMLYEVIGEVELVSVSQIGAGPSQLAGNSKPAESGRLSDREKTPVPERTRSSHVRRKSMERSARSERGQSPNPDRGRATERSRTPERARTPERMRTPDRTKTPDRRKTPVSQVSLAPILDCIIVEQWTPLPSHAMSARDPRTASVSCGRNRERTTGNDPSPGQSSRKEKKASGTVRSRSGDGSKENPATAGDSEEEIAPSPNMRRVFTRLQERRLLTPRGGSSAISGPASQPKDRTAPKKHRTT